MKILYDLFYLEKERHGGISKMWIEYFKKTLKNKSHVSFIVNLKTDNSAISYLKDVNYCNGNIISKSDSSNKYFTKIFSLNIFNSFLLMFKIPKSIDVFHSTGYSNPFFKPKGLKVVTTIHDMVFWDQKDSMKRNISYWDNVWGIYHSLKISDQIITVSETSKKSIIKYFPWTEKKISVIYHGLAEEFSNIQIKPNKKKYFMFIGGRNNYKNFDLLLRAFSLFIKTDPSWSLYVVGENHHTKESESKRYAELAISDNIKDYGLVKKEFMIDLIQNSTAVVIPSLNEGFNFPLIEAMACGCPVLSSKIPVSKEIGKFYASYFDNDEESLFELMIKHKNNSVNYESLERARNYAFTFSWENSYKKLLEVYDS
jgi:glycosyltransferase involved in cell wall biosynthesis